MSSEKDDDSDSENEGFQLLFGGSVTVCDLRTTSAWDEPAEDSDADTASNRLNNNRTDKMSKSTKEEGLVSEATSTRGTQITRQLYEKQNSRSECIFENAFHYTSDGRPVRPPVAIVDLSSINNRGNSLVATRLIRKGEVIYTERAVEATQMPQNCYKCSQKCNDGPAAKSMAFSWSSPRCYDVRACQHCFRSMEPASSLSTHAGANAEESDIHGKESLPSIPMPHLWPVREYGDGESGGETSPIGHIVDRYGRVLCPKCGSLFCSVACKLAHKNCMGSCCKCMSSVQETIHALFCSNTSFAVNKDMPLNEDKIDEAVGDQCVTIQPAVVLAARMFCSEINRHRTSMQNDVQVSNAEDDNSPFYGICGDPEDIKPLELGATHKNTESSNISYTLEPAYLALCEHLTLTCPEIEIFSLRFFERLAAVAARNGFSIATKSPFQSYYPALIRSVGGRGTTGHRQATEEVARALGSTDGVLNRNMDREVADQCTAKLVALFKLTARINHSCVPCAEVRGQEFVDCHIDLVAKDDIQPGQEISISYINVGRTAGRVNDRNRRIRELRARYLFTCDCPRCTNEGS